MRTRFLPFYAEDDGAPQGGGEDDGVSATFQAKLAKMKGDAQAFAFQLYRDNYDLRQKNAELRARVPADGTVLLSPDEAALYARLKELGDPDALSTALSEGRAAAEKAQRLERQQVVQQAAAVAGFRPTVLERLIGDLPVTIADGKAAVVTEAGEVDLSAHAEAAWPEFLPALRSDTTPPPPAGAPFVGQRAAGGPPPAAPNAAATHIKKRYPGPAAAKRQ